MPLMCLSPFAGLELTFLAIRVFVLPSISLFVGNSMLLTMVEQYGHVGAT
jgi:hypothetical protein